MKKNLSGTSIVESLVVMLIIVTGITGMYNILIQSQRLSDTTENRIEAIQIAREGIEAMTNIRNTNWVLYAADYKNCWNTLNYNDTCVGDDSTSSDIADSGSYSISQNTNSRWILTSTPTGNYSDSTYRNNFQVFKDNTTGLYTQGSGEAFNPLFTREIQIEYIEDTDGSGGINSNDEKMKVITKVQWLDNSKATPHVLEIDTILTNWKNKAN